MSRRQLDAETRHHVMASIRGRNTKPEMALRSALRTAGVRGYRCHAKELPGSPDIAFTRWHIAVFVDGVWWHGHPGYFKPGCRGPYWDQKIAGNIERDARVDDALERMGWHVFRIWDVDVLKSPETAASRIVTLLEEQRIRSNGVSHG